MLKKKWQFAVLYRKWLFRLTTKSNPRLGLVLFSKDRNIHENYTKAFL